MKGKVERHLIEEASWVNTIVSFFFEATEFYKHNTAKIFPFHLIRNMKKQRKTRDTASAQKKSKEKKKKDAVVIEIIDDQDINFQTIDPLQFLPKEYQTVNGVQKKHEISDYPWQDVNGLRVARINHFFKKDGEIWFQVMMGRGETIYREPQLMNFSFLSDKYSFQLYTYLLSYFQSHAYGRE